MRMRKSPLLLSLAPLVSFLALLCSPSAVGASNPFSSNVVTLTARNWRREVEESPHAVFVNICRQGWGYCQLLTPEWEKLASAVKGTVKIAYWDTESGQRPPPLLGEIKGTPTIRLYMPKKKQDPKSNAKKVVLDYNYERKAKDMKQFLDQNMPNFIESIRHGVSDLDKFQAKATKHGLPQILLFTSKAKTSSLTKYLSTEFRRQLILGEVYPTKKNQQIMEKYNINPENLPALIVIPPSSSEEEEEGGGKEETKFILYDGNGYTKNKLQSFLSNHALKKKVYPKKKEKVDATTGGSGDAKAADGEAKDETSSSGGGRQGHSEF